MGYQIIGLADIHGNYDLAVRALEEVAEEAGLDNVFGSGKAKPVIIGDVFDRGKENRESLEFALELGKESGKYLAGNHEFFAMFPDLSRDFLSEEFLDSSREPDFYWCRMEDGMREKLLEAAAEGRLEAGFEGPNYSYVHAGAPETDIGELNELLREAGERLLSAFRESQERYEKVQRELVNHTETENGIELESDRYGSLFGVGRNSKGKIEEGGALWRRFCNLPENSPRQVIGHTRIASIDTDEVIPSKARTLNINSVRDYRSGKLPEVFVSVERSGLFQIFRWSENKIEEVFREEF